MIIQKAKIKQRKEILHYWGFPWRNKLWCHNSSTYAIFSTHIFSSFKLIPFLTSRCPCPDIRSCPIILAFLILWNLYSSLNFTFITSCKPLGASLPGFKLCHTVLASAVLKDCLSIASFIY